MSNKIFALIIVLFILSADRIGNAEIIVRHEKNYLEADNESFILDNLVETCARFQASASQLDSIPQYTTFRVQLPNENVDDLKVALIGENLTCAEGLFIMPITSAQAQYWTGIWMTCPLVESLFSQNWEVCTYECQCNGGCVQIQISKRPRTTDESSWSLCDLRLNPPTTDVTGCDSIEGTQNGIHLIKVPALGDEVPVYCDMTTDGGGWTVVLLRKDGSVNFTKEWLDYKEGFGSLDGEFWAGNELVHQLTADGRTYSVRVDLIDDKDDSIFAVYDSFSVASESDNYRLHVAGYSSESSAGDSFTYHDEMMFSTLSHDNDVLPENCALKYGAPWWFNGCYEVFLTGKYGFKLESEIGIVWSDAWDDDNYVTFVKMMIRPNP